ncbi:MAG TPA: DEAD/DEAH box helicase [Frankiaceae bacterium]|jgi:superfamily II DNA/RNA helicase|nr:DEAD/DEAH box helicase [Frankiaceae bacterium]
MPTFADLGLPRPLLTVLEKNGMTAPFAIQVAAIPDALAGRDLLGKAQTGSGKTLAFGLPMLARLAGKQAQPKRPRGLVLVPTRELAGQVHDALAPLAMGLGVRLTVVVGGMSMGRQIMALRKGVDVVIATPGRLEDLVSQGACALGDVSLTVLDEADHMTDLGFLPAVRRILDQVRPGGQRLLFSATLDANVRTLVDRYLNDPATHETTPAGVAVATMDHHLFVVEADHKNGVVTEIANREGRTLLFVRTKHGADRLTKQLRAAGVNAGAIHGGKTQAARTRALTEFKDGTLRTLVATDVAARGIHVDGVDLVLHVDPPADHKDYVHRAGRTARAGATGLVVSVVTRDQERATSAMTRKAGVRARTTRVAPGGGDLARLTGARPASGPALATAPERQAAPHRPGPRRPARTSGPRRARTAH